MIDVFLEKNPALWFLSVEQVLCVIISIMEMTQIPKIGKELGLEGTDLLSFIDHKEKEATKREERRDKETIEREEWKEREALEREERKEKD